MNDTKSVKLFYSYCHEDMAQKNALHQHLAPLVDNQTVEIWHDEHIRVGSDVEETIVKNITQSDIVICFINADYLASESCIKELNLAYSQHKKIVPIILKGSSWKNFKFDDGKKLSQFLVLPLYGENNKLTPISDCEDKKLAWKQVYEKLLVVINDEYSMENYRITKDFNDFLNDCGELKNAHPNKNKLNLDDIYIWPDFERSYFKDNFQVARKENLFDDISKLGKIWILGEDRSGKTSIAKKIFLELKEKGFTPVFFSYPSYPYKGSKIDNQIKKQIFKQYGSQINIDENRSKIVPIMDDFHRYRSQDKLIEALKNNYPKHILITDAAFSFNFRSKKISDVSVDYCRYRISEFYSSKRDEMIRKWLSIDNHTQTQNDFYKNLDEHTKFINSVIGKPLKQGIVPSYPFFLLVIISSYEARNQITDITSQGHCYYALIYLNFRKHKLANEDDDQYLNFLDSLAYHFYKNGLSEISGSDLNDFIEKDYKDKFNLSIKTDMFINGLTIMGFLDKDVLGAYHFNYKYFYYYFVAKYIADNLNETNSDIEEIFANLHTNTNAYIAIFLSHHSKDDIILDYIWLNANLLFEKFTPATLDTKESSSIGKNMLALDTPALPAENKSESVRAKKLQIEDEREKVALKESEDNESEEENDDDFFLKDVRKSIKTAEVMGQIIRNRAGSLPKEKIKIIFENAMNIHLRVMSCFFAFIQENGNTLEKEIQEMIQNNAKKQNKNIDKDKANKLAKFIISNYVYRIILGCLEKIVFSLGSDKLSENISQVCDKINTPASTLIKWAVIMQYKKELPYKDIGKATKDFSPVATYARNRIISYYCRSHEMSAEKRQQIASNLNIPISLSSPREKQRKD